MRIKLSLAAVTYPAAMTTDHHHLASFIYEMIAVADPGLADWLHNQGVATPGREDKRYKPLVFGLPESPRFRWDAFDKVFDRGIVYWQIASPLEQVTTALLAGLALRKTFRIGRSDFMLAEAELLPAPMIQPEMRFIALSPLTASVNAPGKDSAHNSKVYLRDETELGEAIKANLRWKYHVLTGQEANEAPLEFAFDQEFLRQRGGLLSRDVSRLVRYGQTQVKAFAAPFIVSGEPELIAVGWECGFGEANAQGFGLAGLG